MKFNIYNLLIMLFSIFSTSTLIQKVINFNILIGTLVIIIVVYMFSYNLKNKDVILLLCVAFVLVIGLLQCYNIEDSLKDSIYWCISTFLIWKTSDEKFVFELNNSISKKIKWLKWIVAINNIVLISGIFNPNCYLGYWGSSYFSGYSNTPHTLACGACLTLCIALFVTYNTKNNILKILILAPATLAILQSGARTYIVSLAIIWFVFIIYCLKNTDIKLLILPFTLVLGVYLFLNSGMMEKFIYQTTETTMFSAMELFTSGRNVFWKIDLEAYGEGSIINKLFGYGFDYPYIVNLERYKVRIWAHNDLINTLLTSGIFGLSIYLWVIIRSFKALKGNQRFVVVWSVIIYYVFVAFINGLFTYQHYVYSYIFLYVFVISVYLKEAKINVSKNDVY